MKTIPINKEHLLNESKTFCMFPWVHFMINPISQAVPCCVAASHTTTPLAVVNADSTFENIINSSGFKTLRNNMLTGVKDPMCAACYMPENSMSSWRTHGNELFGHSFDEVMSNTNDDGSIDNFKMRYYDLRFNNICNFKCRTCGPTYSSQWAIEENTNLGIHNISKSTSILGEFLSHIDDVELVYFAGGEPLLTEEHYTILEEMIRKNKTHIPIRYNTNCSVLSYKDKNVLDLWKYFDKVSISCSIDHIKEKAEYIRHGTDWGIVESNIKKFRSISNIEFSVNTVLSVFNYLTLNELYEYLIKNGLFGPQDWHFSLIPTRDPSYFSATALPPQLKDIGRKSTNKLSQYMESLNFTSQLGFINNAITFVDSENNWEQQRNGMVREILYRDNLRNESFVTTFPELAYIIEN